MMKIKKNGRDQRDRELLLGNLVTWGSLVSALVLMIALAPLGAAENDQNANTIRAEAAPLIMNRNTG